MKDYTTLLSRIKKNLGEAPLITLVDQIIADALTLRASDIHSEPLENTCRVRVRIDGLLHCLTELPNELAPTFTSRLKIMANLDIAEKRLPQDGRIRWQNIHGTAIDIRISTCPTLWGEKIVLRLLDPNRTPLTLDALGYSALQKQQLQQVLQQPQGLILVTGPTGSGKTVSLYTMLQLLNTQHRNIVTIEDPIEIQLPGITQVAMNAKIGLTFAQALRSFLRQDPDIIMVGEIRDGETAEIAINAAQTGHLVLATLHTNSALETLLRLENMGISRYNLAHSISLLVAQRLARRICPHCKAAGCAQCHQGYKGRIGIHEVLPFSAALQHRMLQAPILTELFTHAQQTGFITLRQDGLHKVADGLTTLDELNRVINE